MIEFRAETDNDRTAIYEVNRLAFGQDTGARLVDMLRVSESYVPGFSIVAVKDGLIGGHIFFTKNYNHGASASIFLIAAGSFSNISDSTSLGISVAQAFSRSNTLLKSGSASSTLPPLTSVTAHQNGISAR